MKIEGVEVKIIKQGLFKKKTSVAEFLVSEGLWGVNPPRETTATPLTRELIEQYLNSLNEPRSRRPQRETVIYTGTEGMRQFEEAFRTYTASTPNELQPLTRGERRIFGSEEEMINYLDEISEDGTDNN